MHLIPFSIDTKHCTACIWGVRWPDSSVNVVRWLARLITSSGINETCYGFIVLLIASFSCQGSGTKVNDRFNLSWTTYWPLADELVQQKVTLCIVQHHYKWNYSATYSVNTNRCVHVSRLAVAGYLQFSLISLMQLHWQLGCLCGWAHPMRDDATLQSCLSLVESIHRLIPVWW